MAPAPVPGRYIHLDAARTRFGDRTDRLGRFFTAGDPMADAASLALSRLPRPVREALLDHALDRAAGVHPGQPRDTPGEPAHTADTLAALAALEPLLAHVTHVPFWVDAARMDRGGAVFLRSGFFGGLVLGAYALPASYCSPAGNKPLVFSGRLTEEVGRRLAETGRFVQAVCQPGGLRVGADGWRASVRVRLIHASVRRMLAASPRWDHTTWGTPINQADMAGTVLLFSLIVVDGLARLAYAVTPQEREDYLHLWRYAGHLQGVDPELLCATESEARVLWDLLSTTQGPPDEDSRALARALMESALTAAHTPEARRRAARVVGFSYAVSRHLLGDDYANGLGYPVTPWRFALPALRAVAGRTGALTRWVPQGRSLALQAGVKYWERTVTQGLRGIAASFPMPDTVRGG